jgi:hypothetical protein
MGITFREAIAELELGLVSSDQLPEIATAGLLEGYRSNALAGLAGLVGEPYDPVEVENLWTVARAELELPSESRTDAGRTLVRAYARLVADGELPPQLGASKIAGIHAVAAHARCDDRAPGDCIDAATIMQLFHAHNGRGYLNPAEHRAIGHAILEECRRLCELQVP